MYSGDQLVGLARVACMLLSGAFVIIPTYDFDSLYPFNIIRLNRPQTVERTNPRSHVWGNTLTVMDDYSGLRFALSDEAARFYYGDLLQDNKRPGAFKIPDDEIKIIIQDENLFFELDEDALLEIIETIDNAHFFSLKQQLDEEESDESDGLDSAALRRHQEQKQLEKRVDYIANLPSRSRRKGVAPGRALIDQLQHGT